MHSNLTSYQLDSQIKRSDSRDERRNSKSQCNLKLYLFIYYVLEYLPCSKNLSWLCAIELEHDARNASFYFIQWVQWGWFFTCYVLKKTVESMDENQIRGRRGVALRTWGHDSSMTIPAGGTISHVIAPNCGKAKLWQWPGVCWLWW